MMQCISAAILIISATLISSDISTASEISPENFEGGKCADIFFQDNFEGGSVSLKHSEEIPDLTYIQERQQRKEVSNNSRISFRIHPGCTVLTADKVYLKGNQLEYDADVESISSLRSLYCSCSMVCKCSEAVLRGRECARAYLGKGCDHCDAYFTPLLTQRSQKAFPDKWKDSVASVLIKKNCTLTIKGSLKESGSPFETTFNAEALDGNKVEVWDKGNTHAITNYECNCGQSPRISRSQSLSRNPNEPPLVTLPKTKKDILSLLNEEKLRNHPGILASLQSLKNGRSPNNAYILILGLTGSGKSSAVNLLFDHPSITKVGESTSTTTDIHEYKIRVRNNELPVNNMELRVIDTPGIADTRGIAQDARFLATLESYLDNHEDLKDRLPNIVLIFSKFNDNRFHGDGSSFVKMLRSIDLFKNRIIDQKYTNVIFVMTHFMSETKEIVTNPWERLSKIRRVIEEFSTMPRPIKIVLAENKPEDYQLPSLNGYYRLPNGDFYPKNLFDEIQKTLITVGDPLGESIIRTGFKNSDNFKIIGKRYELVNEDNPQVTKYLGLLGSLERPLTSTQVSSLLTEAYENEGLSPEVKSQYPGILLHLQRLFFQHNIQDLSEIPKTTLGILSLFKHIHINPASRFLLETALNLRIPLLPGDFILGSGYNLQNDGYLPTPIFNLNETHSSDIGFEIPQAFEVILKNQIENVYNVFTDRNSYLQMRLSDLGLQDAEAIPLEAFASSDAVKDGYNVVVTSEGSSDLVKELSAVIEYHMFQMKLGANLTVTDEFLNALDTMSHFNQSDLISVQSWRDFFKKYGTHLVTSVPGGGSIKIFLKIVDKDRLTSKVDEYTMLTSGMSEIVKHIADSFIGVDSPLNLPGNLQYRIQLVGGGGESKGQNEGGLTNMDFNAWKESVHFNPVMLPTYLELIPISTLAGHLKPEVAQLIEEAATKLFNASLVFVPIVKVRKEGSAREFTPSVGPGGIGDFESIREFSNVFKAMALESQKMQENLLKMMRETQSESQRQGEILEKQREQDEANKLEIEKLRLENIRYEKQLDAEKEVLFMQRLQQLEDREFEREVAEKKLRQDEQLEMTRMQKEQEANMFALIQAENQRMHEIALQRQAMSKSIFQEISEGIQGIIAPVAQAVLPVAMLAGG